MTHARKQHPRSASRLARVIVPFLIARVVGRTGIRDEGIRNQVKGISPARNVYGCIEHHASTVLIRCWYYTRDSQVISYDPGDSSSGHIMSIMREVCWKPCVRKNPAAELSGKVVRKIRLMSRSANTCLRCVISRVP